VQATWSLLALSSVGVEVKKKTGGAGCWAERGNLVMEDVLTSARMTSFERRSVALSGVTKRRKVQSDSHSECSKCRRVLPKAEFWKDARSASGAQGACKACKSGQFKSWTSTWNGKLCSLVHHAHHSHAVRSKRREMGGELEVMECLETFFNAFGAWNV
jgi:hypothetical protein